VDRGTIAPTATAHRRPPKEWSVVNVNDPWPEYLDALQASSEHHTLENVGGRDIVTLTVEVKGVIESGVA
jgi:hypothetical protein